MSDDAEMQQPEEADAGELIESYEDDDESTGSSEDGLGALSDEDEVGANVDPSDSEEDDDPEDSSYSDSEYSDVEDLQLKIDDLKQELRAVSQLYKSASNENKRLLALLKKHGLE